MDRVKLTEDHEFIFHKSFNKGVIMTPSMVENCIGLSNHAKTVYSNILNHAYVKGHSAFPSIYKLAISCSCSVNSIISYIKELEEKGLIKKVSNGRGRSNEYYINECKDVPLLKVSEMMWKIMSGYVYLYGWKEILKAKDKLEDFLESNGIRFHDLTDDQEIREWLDRLLGNILRGGSLEMGILPKGIRNQKKLRTTSVTEDFTKKELKTETFEPTVSKNHWKTKPVEAWKITQFREYFYDRYLDVFGQMHPRNIKKHTGQLRRVLVHLEKDNELLKKYIDTSFEMGYPNNTIEYFSTSMRLGEIQTYLTNGTKPFYLSNSRPKKEDLIDESKKVKLSSKDLFDKVLGGGSDE